MKELRNYTSKQLEKELLSKKRCEFNNEGCTRQAELYLAKKIGLWEIQRSPICFNCWNWIIDRTEEEQAERLERREI